MIAAAWARNRTIRSHKKTMVFETIQNKKKWGVTPRFRNDGVSDHISGNMKKVKNPRKGSPIFYQKASQTYGDVEDR